jgi:DNA mismatch repair protein MutS2
MPFLPGDAVHTPLGKRIVREARNNGRLLVDLNGRAVVLDAASVTPRTEAPARKPRRARPASPKSGTPPTSPPAAATATSRRPPVQGAGVAIDLHGKTVEEALRQVENALNDALLADVPELRLVHGRSGGRIRAALHRRLREVSSVRAFRLDPRNPGVTIVML